MERNRIKRLVRESFGRVRDQLPAIDLMVMAREQAAGVPGAELLSELEALWRKLPGRPPGPVQPFWSRIQPPPTIER
ncbi:ribonuclease P protein component [Rhodanobacter lindaniclasticus]